LEVQSRVSIPKELERTFDCSVILGNLLENAIDAALKSKERFLSLDIRYTKGILRILVCNSYDENLKKKGSRFLTTKLQKEGHGIGLQSVRQIVNQHHGEMEIRTDERFCVSVLLYVPDKPSGFDRNMG
jgi:sensor histidine kinase regulating citrate/malate metabolism